MNFLNPGFLFAGLPLLAAAVIIWAAAGARRKKLLSNWFGSPQETQKHILFSPAGRFWKRLFIFSGMTMLIIAATRPWEGYHTVSSGLPGRDIAVVFDVSKSMLAEDTPPSRLEHARWLTREIALSNPDDRFSLIPFAGKAVVLCPLTADKNTFLMLLDSLAPDTVPHGGTNIAQAINMAAVSLENAPGEEKAILLITDGEELYGQAIENVEALAEKNITFLIAGIGSDSAATPIPEKDMYGREYFKRDNTGNIITTKMSSGLLKELAAAGNGIFFHSKALDDCLPQINEAISRLSRSTGQEEFKTIPIEYFMPFLIAGTIMLAVGLFIPERPLRAHIPILFILLLPAASVKAEEPVAAELFNQGLALHETEPEKAEELYIRALSQVIIPDDVAASAMLNTGELRHREARNQETEAETILAEDLSGAIATLQKSLDSLAAAEEAYINSLSSAVLSGNPAAADMQACLDDRERIENRKKELEELQQQQQQTQQDIQNAAEEHSGNSPESNASEALEQAAESAQALKEAAEEAGAEDLRQRAENAEKNLQEAQESNRNNDPETAGEKINSALEELSSSDSQQQENGDNISAPQQQNDSLSGEEQPDTVPDPSKDEAEAVLQEMAEREKNLREAMQQINAGRLPQPAKDW